MYCYRRYQAVEKINNKEHDFNDTNHENLMRDLNNKQTIKLNF